MRERPTPVLSAYLFAVLVTAAAILVRWLLDPWLGDTFRLVTMPAAVAAAVWYGGYRPALLTALLGYVASEYLFIGPPGLVDLYDGESLIGLLAYLVSCGIIIGFGEALRAARVRARERQEILWTTLASSIGDGVITTDTEGRVTYLNRVAESLVGWTRAEAAGRPLDSVFRIVNEKTRHSVESPTTRALREGAIVGLANHSVLIARDGAERPIDDCAAPIRDEQGGIAGCVLVVRDIAERRRAELALERSERELADTFENASVGLHWVGADGTVLRVNQAELDLLGYGREEYVGRNIAEFHADQPVIEEIIARLLRGETLHQYPARMRCKDGSIRDVLINSNARWEDGRFVHSRSFTLDVTDRKRAEEARALLASIVAASDDAIVSKKVDGTILSWNAGAERLFGYTAAEAVGRSIDLIIPPELREEERSILERLRRGERIDHFETVRVSKNGRRIDTSLTISPLRDESGRVIGASKVARDITERRRAHEALRESEERYRAVVESQSEMLCRFRPDGEILFVNGAYARARGTTPEELIGRSFWQFVPEEDRPEVQSLLDRLTPEAPEVRIENRFETVEGERWFLWTNRALTFDDEGRLREAQSTGIDITQRRQAEEALREREQRYELVLAGAEAAIWDWDVPGKRVVYSPSWKQLRGLSDEEVSDHEHEWSSRIHPADAERVMAAVRAHCEGRTPVFAEEYRVRHKDGGWRWILDRGLARRDAAGQVIRMAGSETDITERKRAEEALRESEARFRTIADSAPVLMWLNDASGCTFVNRAYLDFLGLADQANVYGYAWAQGIHPDDREAYLSAYRDASARRERFTAEFRFRRQDGEYRWMRSVGVARLMEAGEFLGYVGCTYDVHDARMAAAALRDADRRKDEFLATLAHELRNPLAPIGNSLEILKRAEHDRDLLRRARSTIERQMTHLVRLVDDLLDVSRITRDRLELRKTRVELGSIIQQAVETYRPVAEAEEQAIEVAAPEEPVHLHADPVRLVQVLGNLLDNACKYSQRGGRISLAAERQGHDVVFSVRDSGIGMPPHHLHGIFDMFAQVDSALERSRGGLGIGLTLVKRLVELHGGSISARSEGLGLGSEFVVRLPVLVETPEQAEPPAAAAARPATAPLRILVVDDNTDSAETLATLLRMSGHETHLAYDGLDALDAAERLRPDVVLLDIGLPKVNGLEVCRRMRREPWGERLVVVALTGWTQDDERPMSKQAGFDAHLVKPVDHHLLMEILASLPRGAG